MKLTVKEMATALVKNGYRICDYNCLIRMRRNTIRQIFNDYFPNKDKRIQITLDAEDEREERKGIR